MGKLQHGILDERSNQAYVTTKENVLASLNAENGAIAWRQIFERDDRGTIHYLYFIGDGNDAFNDHSVERAYKRSDDSTLLTVSGTPNLYLIRGWNARSGNLFWEWSILSQSQTNENSENVDTIWYNEGSTLYQAVITWGSQIEIAAYLTQSGLVLVQTIKVNISNRQKEKCVIVAPYLVCASDNNVIAIDLTNGSDGVIVQDVQAPQLKAIRVRNFKFFFRYTYLDSNCFSVIF